MSSQKRNPYSFRLKEDTITKINFIANEMKKKENFSDDKVSQAMVIETLVDYFYTMGIDKLVDNEYLDRMQACFELGTKKYLEPLMDTMNHLTFLSQKILEYENVNVNTMRPASDERYYHEMVYRKNNFEDHIDRKLLTQFSVGADSEKEEH